jgi:limonene-1,2-epoxide hydrolase
MTSPGLIHLHLATVVHRDRVATPRQVPPALRDRSADRAGARARMATVLTLMARRLDGKRVLQRRSQHHDDHRHLLNRLTSGGQVMHPFAAALEARDMDAAAALLSDDVVLHSPVVFRPYQGRDVVAAILHAVSRVFEDFHYVREIGAADARDQAFVFHARVGEREIEGSDFLHLDQHGSIDELTVMVRPLTAAHAFADAMKAQLAA